MLNHSPTRRIFMSLILAVLPNVVACSGGDSTAPTQTSVAGTWTLRTINGSGLPFTVVQVGADKVEITSDVLTVASGGAFTQLTTVRITEGGRVTTETIPDAGNYGLNGTAVSFTFNSDGSTGTGTLSGSTLTVASSGFSQVYQKQ